jgi:hypothetical protein
VQGFSPEEVGDSFKSQQRNIHQILRSMTPTLNCQYCGKRYKQLGRLQSHIDNKHPEIDSNTTDTTMLRVVERVFHDVQPDHDSRVDCNPNLYPGKWCEYYENAGLSVDYVPTAEEQKEINAYTMPCDVIKLFGNEKVYNLAKWLIKHNIPVIAIQELLSNDMPFMEEVLQHIPSNYILREKVSRMSETIVDWSKVTTEHRWCDDQNTEPIAYYARDIIPCIKGLLGQPQFKNHQQFAPQHKYENDQRIYTDINTADWWWEQQVSYLPVAIIILKLY